MEKWDNMKLSSSVFLAEAPSHGPDIGIKQSFIHNYNYLEAGYREARDKASFIIN